MCRIARVLMLMAVLPFCGMAQAPTDPMEPRITPSIGLHYGGPLRTSVALGLLIDASDRRNDGSVISAEIGQQANQLSAGYFRSLGQFGSGYSLRVAALRTRSDPWNASAKSTYLGGEAYLMVAFGVGGRVGYMHRISSSADTEHANVVSFGALIGL
jgi:hypothetical protein